MSHPRRTASKIALDILDVIEEKEEATKWDILKTVGNSQQFTHWIDDFFIKEKTIEEKVEGRYYYYSITERGELFHKLLKSGNMVDLFNRVSGKRLRRT
jgi:predicted transcriptional regulator